MYNGACNATKTLYHPPPPPNLMAQVVLIFMPTIYLFEQINTFLCPLQICTLKLSHLKKKKDGKKRASTRDHLNTGTCVDFL